MKSFILVSFGFMAFAFYEMSGGDDFAPASVRMSTFSGAVVPETPLEPAKAETVLAADETPELPAHEAVVTRVSLDLTSVQAPAPVVENRTVQIEQAVASAIAEADEDVSVPTNVSVTNSADTPAIIPSLIAPNDSGAAVLQTVGTSTEMREVTARRVNVRGGPGTNYGIVAKLVQGDTVEILEDTGTGWVRMRALTSDAEGWMADFLLSSG